MISSSIMDVDIDSNYISSSIYVADFLQQKSDIDASNYYDEELSANTKTVVVKFIYNFYEKDGSYYVLVKGYSENSERYFSYVMFVNFDNKNLRNLGEDDGRKEDVKLKFYCDFNNTKGENSNDEEKDTPSLNIVNYNCYTDHVDRKINVEEDNLIKYLDLADEEEAKYFDLSSVNKTMNLSEIKNNEVQFNEQNLESIVIFSVKDGKNVSLNERSSFEIEGSVNSPVVNNVNFALSLKSREKELVLSCSFHPKNEQNSLLKCGFSDSNFGFWSNETKENETSFYIKEKEVNCSDRNVFLSGMNKVQFLYRKGAVVEYKENKRGIVDDDDNVDEGEEKDGKNTVAIAIVIILSLVIIGMGVSVFCYVTRSKDKKELKQNNMPVENINLKTVTSRGLVEK